MKALLIGGTGTISTAVSRLLLASGSQLYLLNRGSRNTILPQGAIELRGDAHDEAAVAALLAGHQFDVVANFIAFTPADVERDRRLFAGKTKQYIFISSASAYQKPLSNYRITESTPLANPYWEYSRQKIACEEALMRFYRENGFPVTIVRPSHTYNERSVPVAIHGHGGSWQVLRRMLAGKPVLLPGDGSSLWTLTHSDDFAKGFIGLMGNIHAIGEAVHITSDESLTWMQAHAILASALGVPLRVCCVPSALLAAWGNRLGYDFEGGLLGDKSNTIVFDNTKLKRLVPGFAATIRFDEGARRSVETFLADPALQTEDPAFDAFCDRVVEVMDTAFASITSKFCEPN